MQPLRILLALVAAEAFAGFAFLLQGRLCAVSMAAALSLLQSPVIPAFDFLIFLEQGVLFLLFLPRLLVSMTRVLRLVAKDLDVPDRAWRRAESGSSSMSSSLVLSLLQEASIQKTRNPGTI